VSKNGKMFEFNHSLMPPFFFFELSKQHKGTPYLRKNGGLRNTPLLR